MDVAEESNSNTPPPERSSASSYMGSHCRRRKLIYTDEGSSMDVEPFDPFSINYLAEELDSGKYGNLTEDIRNLLLRRRQSLDARYAKDNALPCKCSVVKNIQASKAAGLAPTNVIDVEDDDDDDGSRAVVVKQFVSAGRLVSSTRHGILHLEDEDEISEKLLCPHQEVDLMKPNCNLLMEDFVVRKF